MKSERTTKTFFVNPNRDRQYDAALQDHLAATWELPGRTYSQIARALGAGDIKIDKHYAQAIMWALADMAQNDETTIAWCPNLRLPQAALDKKVRQNKHNDHNRRLYKFAPYRKLIDRNPSRTDEIVQGVIIGYLTRFGPRSGLAIRQALQVKLGHIDKRIVERGLVALVAEGKLTPEKIRAANATVYSVPSKPVSP